MDLILFYNIYLIREERIKMIRVKELKEELNLNTQETIDLILKDEICTYSRVTKDFDYGNKIVINLMNADLKNVDLYKANLENANLMGSDLKGANLIGANLKGAYLEGVCLYDIDLYNGNFRYGNLKDAELTKAVITEKDKKYYTIEQLEIMKIIK